MQFNERVYGDPFELHDAGGEAHWYMMLVDAASGRHVLHYRTDEAYFHASLPIYA